MILYILIFFCTNKKKANRVYSKEKCSYIIEYEDCGRLKKPLWLWLLGLLVLLTPYANIFAYLTAFLILTIFRFVDKYDNNGYIYIPFFEPILKLLIKTY